MYRIVLCGTKIGELNRPTPISDSINEDIIVEDFYSAGRGVRTKWNEQNIQ